MIDSKVGVLRERTLEPVIRQHYVDVTGRSVHVVNKTLIHPEHHLMLANVDGLSDDQRAVIK